MLFSSNNAFKKMNGYIEILRVFSPKHRKKKTN